MDVKKRHELLNGTLYFPLKITLPGMRIAFRSLHFSQFRNAIPRHSHSFFETVYFINGRGTYTRVDTDTGQEENFEYGPGTLVDVAPGTIHFFTPAEMNRFAYWIWEAAGGPGFRDIRPIKVAAGAPAVGPLVELVRHECGRASADSRSAIQLYVRQLMRNMFIALYPGKMPQKTDEPLKKAPPRRLADMILTFIRDNFYLNISLPDVARQFNMTPRHLIRILKSAEPPVRFRAELNRTRIQAACQIMVRKKNVSLAGIAEAVGFKDEYYFAKVFKKETGEPPGRFRRRLHGGPRKEKHP